MELICVQFKKYWDIVVTTEIYTEVTVGRKKQVLNKYNYRNKLSKENT